MTTPRLPSRRSGWAVLLAVAGVVVGGAFAVRLGKRKRAAGPAAPSARTGMAPARPVAPGSSPADPSRSLVRMAVGAGIVVVLALFVVVATRPSDVGETATPHSVVTASPGPNGAYLDVIVPGPVGRDERVALTGDLGARAEVEIKRISDPVEFPNYTDSVGQRSLVATIHIHNTGRAWIGARLDADAWVVDTNGTNYPANQMLSLTAGPDRSTDPQLSPDWQIDQPVGFSVPLDAHLTRLHISLDLGGAKRTAEWSL